MSEEQPVVDTPVETPAPEAAPEVAPTPVEETPSEPAPAPSPTSASSPSGSPPPVDASRASGGSRGSIALGGGGFSCAICSKVSFPAETVMFETKPYHAECFRCSKCNKKLEGGSNAAGYEGVIYCRQCFERDGLHLKQRQVKWTPKTGGSNPVASRFGGGGTPCTVCGKTAYAGETVQFEMKPYHGSCFKCSDCTKDLKPAETGKYEEKLYCTRCFEKNNFHRKQAQVNWTKKDDASSTRASQFGGGGTPCTVCNATVFSSEAVQYDQKVYHIKCFKCSDCQNEIKQSDAGKFEDKIFCMRCFGAGGYARKQAAVKWTPKTTTTPNAAASRFGGGGTPCTACNLTVYASEGVSYDQKVYHAKCLACSECKKECKQSEVAKYEEKLYCQRCFEKNGLHLKQAQVKFQPKASSTPARFNLGGGGTKCTVCNTTVYPAETVQYEQRAYHSKCFACLTCKKELTPSAAEHAEGRVYCKKCFMEAGLHMARLTPAKTVTE